MTSSTPASARLSKPVRMWRYRVFAATWLSYFGFYFTRKPFFIVKAALEDKLGFDPNMLAFLGGTYLVAYAVGQFIGGSLGNKYGPRIVLLIGMAVSIGANVVFGFTNSWATFAVFMAINGLAQATGWSCNLGTMANWFRRGERGTVLGFWATNYQVGGVASNALAAYMLGEFGFQWSFFAGSVVLLLVWAFFLVNQRNKPEDTGNEPLEDPDETEVSTSEAGRRRWSREVWINVLAIGVFYFFVKFIRYALWSWAPYLLNRFYGMELAEAGYLSTIFDLAGIAGVIAAGYVSDRFFEGRRAKVSFFFIVAMALSCVLLYVGGAADLTLFAVGIGLVGFTLYGPDALMSGAGAIDVGSRRDATLAAGIINGMGSLGAVLQEFVLGSLLDSGDVGGVFATLLGSASLAAICLALLLLRNKMGKADI